MNFLFNTNTIELSVTELANFFLNNDLISFSEGNIAGIKNHRDFNIELLDTNINFLEKEFSINHQFTLNDINIRLNGRIDFIDFKYNKIYELKTVNQIDFDDFKIEKADNYIFQNELYSFMYFKKENIFLSPELLITTNGANLKKIKITNSIDTITKKVSKYLKLLIKIYNFRKNLLYKNFRFPFKVQNEFQDFMHNEINQYLSKVHFIEAPFGSGKTIGTIFPILKMYQKQDIQFFFLTSRNSQKKNIEKDVNLLGLNPLVIPPVKELCKYKLDLCRLHKCKYYTSNRYELISNFFNKKTNKCPYLENRALAKIYPFCIADYNHLLYSTIKPYTKNGILIIDEFHSFIKRFKAFTTISLTDIMIKNLEEILNKKGKNQYQEDFEQLHKFIDSNQEEYNHFLDKTETSFGDDLLEFINTITYDLNNNSNIEFLQNVMPKIMESLRLFESLGQILTYEHKIAAFPRKQKKIITLENLFHYFNDMIKSYSMVKGLSATLKPRELIYQIAPYSKISSISTKRPIKATINPKFDTISAKRKFHYLDIAKYIEKIISTEPQNVLVFFNSYKFLESVLVFILSKSINKIIYKSGMSIDQLAEQIDKRMTNLISIPYNSILSEGINLPIKLDKLICVGFPFASPDDTYQVHKAILEEKNQNSFNLLSLFPALNETLQASGRIGRKVLNQGNSSQKKLKKQEVFFISKSFTNTKVLNTIYDSYENVIIEK